MHRLPAFHFGCPIRLERVVTDLVLAQSVLTWIVVTYALTTEKVTAWNVGYHILAVVVLDGALVW